MKFVGVSAPAWTILGDYKKDDWKNPPPHPVPGPGEYPRDLGDKITKEMAPSWSLNTGEKRGDWIEGEKGLENLGPGLYHTPIDYNQQLEEQIKRRKIKGSASVGRMKDKTIISQIGPDSYNPGDTKKSAPKFSFGYRFWEHQNQRADNNIGPGQYNPNYSQQEFSKGIKIPSLKKTKRKGKHKDPVTPGPGRYQSTDNILDQSQMRYTSKKGTFGTKTQKRFKDFKTDAPSAGTYNVDIHTIGYSLSKIKKANRMRVSRDEVSTSVTDLDRGVPGPGAYAPSLKPVTRKAPGFSFGSSKRYSQDPEHLESPYDHELAVKRLRAKRLQRSKDGKQSNSHSRNKLKPMTEEEIRQQQFTTFGRGMRSIHYVRDPGPDYYDVTAKEPPGPRFSLRGKWTYEEKKESLFFPGPGMYNTEHNFMVGSLGPKYGLGSGVRPAERASNHGGGNYTNYTINRDIGDRGITIAKAKRRPMHNGDPDVEVGPGEYDLKSTIPQLQCFEEKAMKEAAFKLSLD